MRRVAPMVLVTGLVAAGFVVPWVAGAFTEPRTYLGDPREGGGGGRWFTGSPAEGYGCSVCHTGPGPEPLEVEGLPDGGYEPGETYDLRVAWPDFAARADALRADQEGPPGMGLVAEFVAESGEGSGIIEIASAENADPDELCVLPEGAAAAQLFGQRPGETANEEGTRCEASSLGHRCLVAVLTCGARELRMRWTAPAEPQGAIWFAAGFVATEHAEGNAENDSVTELSMPLLPVDSALERHRSELHDGCAVHPGGAARTPWLALCAIALLCIRRRTRRRGDAP